MTREQFAFDELDARRAAAIKPETRNSVASTWLLSGLSHTEKAMALRDAAREMDGRVASQPSKDGGE